MEGMVLEVTGRVGGGERPEVSERMLSAAALFGVELRGCAERVLFENVRVAVRPGEVVLVTGASGAGKSTMLRAIEAGLRERARVVRLEEVAVERDRAIVDCFAGTLDAALTCLARAGLSEARLLLQTPAELSEGQRFRYRLSQFFAGDAQVLVADEFGATLDRVTARCVAHQLAKFVRESGKTAIVATTHEDLAEDLAAAVRVYVGLDGCIEVYDMNGRG